MAGAPVAEGRRRPARLVRPAGSRGRGAEPASAARRVREVAVQQLRRAQQLRPAEILHTRPPVRGTGRRRGKHPHRPDGRPVDGPYRNGALATGHIELQFTSAMFACFHIITHQLALKVKDIKSQENAPLVDIAIPNIFTPSSDYLEKWVNLATLIDLHPRPPLAFNRFASDRLNI